MRMRIAVAGLVVAAAVSGWRACATSPSAPAGTPHVPRVAPDRSAVPVGAESAGPSVGTSDRDDVGERIRAGDGGSSTVQVPDDARWVDVLVVDAASGAPVPDADVAWLTEAQWAHVRALPRAQRVAFERDEGLVFEQFGWRTRSDANGRARIAVCGDWASVRAMANTRYGESTVHGDRFAGVDAGQAGGVPRIELRQDVTLRARVSAVDGQVVAGAPVDFWPVGAGHDEQVRQHAVRASTSAEGIATFEHAQLLRRWPGGSRRGQPVDGWRVGLAIPGAAASADVDPDHVPAGPVELRLPPTGGLRLRLVAGGRPATFVRDVRLAVDGAFDHAVWTRDVDAEGVVEFEPVSLGRTFVVAGGEEPWMASVAGPTLVGQVMEHTIDVAVVAIVIGGRLLGPDGAPLRDVAASFELDGEPTAGATTDAEGVFHVVLPRSGEQPLQVDAMSVQSHQPRQLDGLIAPFPVGDGGAWVGDVRLGETPVVVAGRVTSETGELRDLYLGVERAGDGGWHPEMPPPTVVIEKDGAFTARGRIAPGRLRLVTRSFRHLPVEPIEFRPGDEHVQIALRAGHALEVRAVLPAGLKGYALQWQLVGRESGAAEAGFDLDHAGLARLVWRALEAGEYTFEVRHPVTSELLASERIVVPTPGAAAMTKVQIDLRDRVRVQTIVVARRGGDAETFACLVFPSPQRAEPWRGLPLREGSNVIALADGLPDLLFAARGYRAVTLSGAGADVQVALERFATAELHVLAASDVLGGARLEVLVEPESPLVDGGRRVAWFGRVVAMAELLAPAPRWSRIDAHGASRVPLGDGPHRLRLRLRAGDDAVELAGFTPRSLPTPGSYQVSVPAEELARAAAALRR